VILSRVGDLWCSIAGVADLLWGKGGESRSVGFR
jgi:hypothetical protein